MGATICVTSKKKKKREIIAFPKGSCLIQVHSSSLWGGVSHSPAPSYIPSFHCGPPTHVFDHDHHNYPFPLVKKKKKILVTFAYTLLNYHFMSSYTMIAGPTNLTHGIQKYIIVMKTLADTFSHFTATPKYCKRSQKSVFLTISMYIGNLVVGCCVKDSLYFLLFFFFFFFSHNKILTYTYRTSYNPILWNPPLLFRLLKYSK